MNAYEDMLELPHHQSAKRPHMTRLDRAAQFAPFAALSGFEGEIAEAGRLTDGEIELTEWAAEQVDEALRALRREIGRRPEVEVTYFAPDGRKNGGAYRIAVGRVRKIQELERILLLDGDARIQMDRIVRVLMR